MTTATGHRAGGAGEEVGMADVAALRAAVDALRFGTLETQSDVKQAARTLNLAIGELVRLRAALNAAEARVRALEAALVEQRARAEYAELALNSEQFRRVNGWTLDVAEPGVQARFRSTARAWVAALAGDGGAP